MHQRICTASGVFAALAGLAFSVAAEPLGNYQSHAVESPRSIVITSSTGQKVRVTAYGSDIVRVQAVPSGKTFFADTRNELVVTHAWPGDLTADASGATVNVKSGNLVVKIQKSPMLFEFCDAAGTTILKDAAAMDIDAKANIAKFAFNDAEHYCGGGHGCSHWGALCDLADRVDAKGRTNLCYSNTMQAPFICPFWVSSHGYGVFVHTTFPAKLNFVAAHYGFSISSVHTDNQMDFFVLKGNIPQLVDLYTQLTGRPYFPPVSGLGFGLSDKKGDIKGTQAMCMEKINQMRRENYPMDVLIFDNNWKQARCGPNGFAWYAPNYPDPEAFTKYVNDSGISVMFDWNSCNCTATSGWNTSWGIPGYEGSVRFPDLTNPAAVKWFTDKWMNLALNEKMPGSMIWLDEFEKATNGSSKLYNGMVAEEWADYYFYQVIKSVTVAWENYYGDKRRFLSMCRGFGVGAQRYGMHWTGDIMGDLGKELNAQVRMMQISGICGDPFFAHDNGGYLQNPTPEEYHKWVMAQGCFSPVWKPHGDGDNSFGNGRWPLNRTDDEKATARRFIHLRYMMLPYNYTYAHLASTTGAPMARPMMWEHQNDATAWTKEHQYYWGKELIVAPNGNASGTSVTSVWLPAGNWYNFWTEEQVTGPATKGVSDADNHYIGVFVREGAIIPMSPEVKRGSKWRSKDTLDLHVYTGKDGSFELYDDDGVTLKYKTGACMTTELRYKHLDINLTINAAKGTYTGAPANRKYRLYFHGLDADKPMKINGIEAPALSETALAAAGVGRWYNAAKKTLVVHTAPFPVTERVWVGLNTSAGPGQPAPVALTGARIVSLNGTSLHVVLPASAAAGKPTCALFDVSGRRVATIPPFYAKGLEVQFHLPTQSAGVRILTVQSEGRTILSSKMNTTVKP